MENMHPTADESFLERILLVEGKSPDEMTTEELTDAAMRLFMMGIEEYRSILSEKAPEHAMHAMRAHLTYANDVLALADIARSKGAAFGIDEVKDRIMETDLGLGYFEEMFKKELGWLGRDEPEENGLYDFHKMFHVTLDSTREQLKKHLEADSSLREKHTIPAPELMDDKTLQLNIVPLAIDFFPDGKLTVLGYRESDMDIMTNMILNVYDVEKGELLRSKDTLFLPSIRTAAGGMLQSCNNTLHVGSDSIIYLDGGKWRYDAGLEEVFGNESKFMDAKAIIEKLKEEYGVVPLHVAYDNGIFYFALAPDFPTPVLKDNIILATDGKGIIGRPFHYTPSGDRGPGRSDINPRVVVQGNRIYFKAYGKILSADRSCTEEAWNDAFPVVPQNEVSIPSNHCVTEEGTVYAVSQLKEEAVQSIKGYDKEGRFATHTYPENPAGGFASLRSMAIHDNILAYTSLDGNKIHFYRLSG